MAAAARSVPVPEPAGEAAPPRATLWLASLAFWTLLGLLESSLAYVRMLGTPQQRTLVQALVNNMPWWLIWALLTPSVFAVARAAPVYGARWRRGTAIHVLAAFLFASVHLIVEGTTFYYTTSRGGGFVTSPVGQIRTFFQNFMILDLVTYAVIVGGWYAVDFYRRYRESALRSARWEAQTARLELGLAEARLQALRMELNPHFLFNALNAVSGLVRRDEGEAAVRMLARLSELLRATLDRGLAREIPLADELEFLERYLDIERARFGDRLTIVMDCDDEVMDALVPTLILQPLVENAVRHGIGARPGPGSIHVQARRDGDRLLLAVRDTGGGVDADAVRAREGIGLSNTRARLAELYGEAGALVLANAPGGGARAEIALPWREAPPALRPIEEERHVAAPA